MSHREKLCVDLNKDKMSKKEKKHSDEGEVDMILKNKVKEVNHQGLSGKRRVGLD